MVKLVFDEVLPGLNGDKGYIRMHWRTYSNLLKRYQLIVMSQTRKRIKGPVILHLKRYYWRNPMDLVNLHATLKLPEDALVKCKVIEDDHPDIVVNHIVEQYEVKTPKEQKSIIIVIPYEKNNP